MASDLRFPKAITNARPFKSHRYDVHGLKVNRNLSLFNQHPLNTWLQLEADPTVLSYCERPIVIPDTSPRRIVDFWVAFSDHEELWLISSDKDAPPPEETARTLHAFCTWAESQHLSVREVCPINQHACACFLDNWGRIVRMLSANRRYVMPSLLKQVEQCITASTPLVAILQRFQDEDSVLVQSAVFILIHGGKLRCTDIGTNPLGPTSVLEPA